MKDTLDELKLQNILESPGMKEKLARAGWRGQGAARHLHVLPLRDAADRVPGRRLVYFFVLSHLELVLDR